MPSKYLLSFISRNGTGNIGKREIFESGENISTKIEINPVIHKVLLFLYFMQMLDFGPSQYYFTSLCILFHHPLPFYALTREYAEPLVQSVRSTQSKWTEFFRQCFFHGWIFKVLFFEDSQGTGLVLPKKSSKILAKLVFKELLPLSILY
jgi:hypothetical protein